MRKNTYNFAIVVAFLFAAFAQAQPPPTNIPTPLTMSITATTNAVLLGPSTNLFSHNTNLFYQTAAALGITGGASVNTNAFALKTNGWATNFSATNLAVFGGTFSGTNIFSGVLNATNALSLSGVSFGNGNPDGWSNGVKVWSISTNGHIALSIASTNDVTVHAVGNTNSGVLLGGVGSSNSIHFLQQATNTLDIDGYAINATNGGVFGGNGSGLIALNGSAIASGVVGTNYMFGLLPVLANSNAIGLTNFNAAQFNPQIANSIMGNGNSFLDRPAFTTNGSYVANTVTLQTLTANTLGTTPLNASSINSGTVGTNFEFGLLPVLANSNGVALTNISAGNISSGTLALARGGTGNPSGYAVGLSNSATGPIIITNLGGQQALLFYVPVANQETTGDTAYIVASLTPRASSYGGFFFPVGGTNLTYNGFTGTATGVLADGQTNYVYDWKAGQLSSTPANGVNINNGMFGIFMNPGWPFSIGGFYNGFQNDWLYYDPTNWIIHFPKVNGSANQDPRQSGVTDTLKLDLVHGTASITNLVLSSVNTYGKDGNLGLNGCLSIGTTNALTSGERLLVQAAGSSFGPGTNYAEVMIQSTSGNDGPSVRWSAHGGSDFNMVSTGSGDGTGANYFVLYSFANSQYEWEVDPHGNMLVPNGSVIMSKAPTLSVTNATPGGWTIGVTAPRIWWPVTNGTTVYYLQGY